MLVSWIRIIQKLQGHMLLSDFQCCSLYSCYNNNNILLLLASYTLYWKKNASSLILLGLLYIVKIAWIYLAKNFMLLVLFYSFCIATSMKH